MVPAARYAELETALGARGCSLLTDTVDYRRAHELPGWYAEFDGLTPRSVWRAAVPGIRRPPPTSWPGSRRRWGRGPAS